MSRIAGPHWIKHSHLFDPDEYECSRCGAVFKKKYPACPNCVTTLRSSAGSWTMIERNKRI